MPAISQTMACKNDKYFKQKPTHTHSQGGCMGLEFMLVQPADEVDSENCRDNHSVDVQAQ